MHVTKRDGRHEAVQFDKITARIKKLVRTRTDMHEVSRGLACLPARLFGLSNISALTLSHPTLQSRCTAWTRTTWTPW